jgi:hypothetical protein
MPVYPKPRAKTMRTPAGHCALVCWGFSWKTCGANGVQGGQGRFGALLSPPRITKARTPTIFWNFNCKRVALIRKMSLYFLQNAHPVPLRIGV